MKLPHLLQAEKHVFSGQHRRPIKKGVALLTERRLQQGRNKKALFFYSTARKTGDNLFLCECIEDNGRNER